MEFELYLPLDCMLLLLVYERARELSSAHDLQNNKNAVYIL